MDLHVSNSGDYEELVQTLKQLSHAMIQNDKMTITNLMDIFTTDSLSSMRRKLENSEDAKIQRDQTAAEQQERMQQAAMEAEAKEKELERAHDFAMEDKKTEGAMSIENLRMQVKNIDRGLDLDGDGVRDEVEIHKAQIQNEANSIEGDKQRAHESKEADKDRENKKELERLKAKNKPSK